MYTRVGTSLLVRCLPVRVRCL